jgi:chemotaxis response regulator CheB
MEPATAASWFVAVGASGRDGLEDVRELLQLLPASLDATVLIVLHRPWHRVSHLQSILARASQMPLLVAQQGERFEPGCAYIGEPADHLTLAARSFGELLSDPAAQYRNRTVDLLFHSVAMHGRERVIGVVLSGSLDDGSRGLAAIHHAGGLTMVLTPAAPPRRGMPENAIAYDGPIDLIGNSHQIAGAIIEIVGTKEKVGRGLLGRQRA